MIKLFESILSKIRAWKLKSFKDWQWDLLVGGVLGLIALPFSQDWLILVLPLLFTVWNQIYNKLFEPKDFLLRMLIPLIIYLLIKILALLS
jgi:hypothetical protein